MKGRAANECVATPVVWDAADEAHFSPTAPRVFRWDLYDRGNGEYKESGKNIKGHLRN